MIDQHVQSQESKGPIMFGIGLKYAVNKAKSFLFFFLLVSIVTALMAFIPSWSLLI